MSSKVLFINYATSSPFRPILIREDGDFDPNPKFKKYLDEQPDRFEAVMFRYKIRLLFKRIRRAIGNYMCYAIKLLEDGYEFIVKNSAISKKLGIKKRYTGRTLFEIYVEISKDISSFLENFDKKKLAGALA